MGKTRDLFKTIRDTKGTYHTNMGTISDRNDMDLTKEIKKRLQENTEDYTRKILMTQTQGCHHSPRARHPGV